MKQLDTITFQRIETFFTVAESKSFSVAAEKLHMSQSAISKIIASMEENWK